jgi:hypothetical protein
VGQISCGQRRVQVLRDASVFITMLATQAAVNSPIG